MKFHIFNNGLMVETGVSGSDRRAMEWTKLFLKKKILVRLYTSVFGRKRFENYGSGCELVVVKDSRFLSQNTFFVYLFRAIKSFFLIKKVQKDDIFYSTSDLLPDSLPALWGKLTYRQTKWLTGCHLLATNPLKNYQDKLIFPSARGIYYFLSQRVILLLAKHLADLVMVSNFLDRDFLLKKGFKAEQVIVTYGAVDQDEIKKAKLLKTKYDASFIGRYHPQKGLDDLLEAWKIICGKFPKAKIVMMGELEPLLPKIKKMGLQKNIDFLGFIDGSKKYSYLKSSKIFLFPSHYESFGMVAAEAMAAGLPVVAYDLPIYKKIYPRGMIKVPLGNISEFAQKVIDLLSNEENRVKISREAYENSQKFSWEKTAEQIIKQLNYK